MKMFWLDSVYSFIIANWNWLIQRLAKKGFKFSALFLVLSPLRDRSQMVFWDRIAPFQPTWIYWKCNRLKQRQDEIYQQFELNLVEIQFG